ncbi:hypothetical protein F5Y08DRAFT_348446 [Xylaria arbuscula]|nr:hypothetical protein F5Y08DRAFT_348446 [Xylaria arbuscula]
MAFYAISGSRRPRLPQLPLEIHREIIEVLAESSHFAELWLRLRLVSRSFKAIIESLFIRKLIPQMKFGFGARIMHGSNLSESSDWRYTFSFHSLDDKDDERAVYSLRWPSNNRKAHDLDNSNLDGDEGDAWDNVWGGFIQIGNRSGPINSKTCRLLSKRLVPVTDTLPGLMVDWERHSISFLWKEMLVALFTKNAQQGLGCLDRLWLEVHLEEPGRNSSSAASRAQVKPGTGNG